MTHKPQNKKKKRLPFHHRCQSQTQWVTLSDLLTQFPPCWTGQTGVPLNKTNRDKKKARRSRETNHWSVSAIKLSSRRHDYCCPPSCPGKSQGVRVCVCRVQPRNLNRGSETIPASLGMDSESAVVDSKTILPFCRTFILVSLVSPPTPATVCSVQVTQFFPVTRNLTKNCFPTHSAGGATVVRGWWGAQLKKRRFSTWILVWLNSSEAFSFCRSKW